MSDEERERRVRLFTPWIERLVALIRGRVRAGVPGSQHSCPAANPGCSPALDCCHCLSPSLTCHGELPPSHCMQVRFSDNFDAWHRDERLDFKRARWGSWLFALCLCWQVACHAAS